MDMYIRGDAALKEINSEDDFLGVKVFAEKIAQSIFKQCAKGNKSQSVADQSLVFGLEGAWGSGKSSLKNEILKQIRMLSRKSKIRKPIIVEFDPWIQRGVQPLVGALLEEIKSAVISSGIASGEIKHVTSGQLKWIGSKATEYRDAISSLAEFSASIVTETLPIPYMRTVLAGIGKVSSHIPRRADDPALSVRSLRQQKKEVNNSLQQLGESLIISIDDIDRLDPQEIMEVMRLVRSVADFSNTIYLLNYDPKIVAQAAEKVHGDTNSRSYIDKIVNVPLRVPVPEAFDLKSWFLREVMPIVEEWRRINGFQLQGDEEDNIGQVVGSAGTLFFRTPRDVCRSLDAVRLALASIQIEVNIPDLVWISIIKIGSSDLYHWIERYLAEMAFISKGDAFARDFEISAFETDLKDISKKIGISTASLEEFLSWQLPMIDMNKVPEFLSENNDPAEPALKGSFRRASEANLDLWTFQIRICSPTSFRLYFGYQNPKHAFHEQDKDRLLACIEISPQATRDLIFEFDEQQHFGLPSKAELLFRHVRNSGVTGLSQSQKFHLLSALAMTLDDFPKHKKMQKEVSMRGWSTAADIIPLIFEGEDNDEFMQFIDELFANGKSISWLTYAANRWRESLRTAASGSNVHFDRARNALLKRYGQMDLRQLSMTANPTGNLFAFNELAYGDESREFVQNRSESDGDFLLCLELILGISFIPDPPTWHRAKSASMIGLREVSKFYVADQTISRLKALKDQTLQGQQSKRAGHLLWLLNEFS